MPLDKALAMLKETAETDRLKIFIAKVEESVRGGKSLYQSLLPFEADLGRQYLVLIRAGETSGSLHVVLKELTVQLEADDKLRNYIISSMTYPIILLVVAVLLFAFSTMISWSYYGMRAWSYLFGKSKKAEMIYKMFFLIVVVVGASVSLGAVLDFSDMMILAMAFPNIIGLYIMSGEVKVDLDEYWRKLKAGELYKAQRVAKK